MVKKHLSLADAEIRVSTGTAGREVGYSNNFGPALVPVLIPFRPQELRIAADNAPIGYNIGAGEYVAMPSARSGVVISVGSEAYLTGLAVLTTFDGQPLALATGRIIQIETGLESTFFTNRSGRAVFTQLAPGTYRGFVDGNQFAFEFTVPKDAASSISLGTLKLELSR
jgi:outer membrane usher protein FimD/PapC